MSEFIRPSYLEPIPPTQRVPDYWPPPLTEQPTPATAPVEAPIPQGIAEVSPTGAEKKTVKLVGNIGTRPDFRTTAAGSLKVEFALAQHNEDGSTTWYKAYATDKKDEPRKQYASRLQRLGIERGMLIELTGTWQVRMREVNGKQKREVKFYCYGGRILGGNPIESQVER